MVLEIDHPLKFYTKYQLTYSLIANCRKVRGLGRGSYIDLIENLNISTEMLLNEKLPIPV